MLKGIMDADGVGFETSHEELGKLLGYEAGKVEADATPDPWWRADDSFCFVFEDHAGQDEGNDRRNESASGGHTRELDPATYSAQ